MLKYLRKIDILFAFFVVGLIILQVWLDLTMPDYTQKLTNIVVSGNATMADVWKNGGMMLLCAFGSMVCSFSCGFFTARIASHYSKTLRKELFSKITSFSSAEMSKFSTPSLITRTTNDVTQIQNFVAMGLQTLVKAPVMAIWAIAKISNTSIEWTLATFICVAVIVIAVIISVVLCLPKFKKMQNLIDNLNNATRENVDGIKVVHAFNAENYQQAKFEKANNELTKTQLFTSKTMGILMPIMNLCMNGLTLAIYWIGAYLMNNTGPVENQMLIGNLTAFTQYAMQVVMSFLLLIFVFIILPRVIVSVKRVKEVLNTKLSMENGSIKQSEDSETKIEFKNVSFRYYDGDEDVISNISFKVKKGDTIALIGATGSGKSTIIDLMPRFHDIDSGEVLIDEKNVKDYDYETLQDKIAVVTQKAVLFKGDIKSNITYGSNDEPDLEKIEKALKIAKADFVFNLEKGINSEVAQGGTNFSGGQKQRLSIARAIYKDPEILIFDDSFSALDYKTDKEVRGNIDKYLTEKTIVIVAQRIGTIRNADKILVIDEGQIVGEGTHDELVKNCALYKEIALSQLSKEEL